MFLTFCAPTRSGYSSSREDLKPVFGEDFMSKTTKLEVNDEDEIGLYTPSGQPGFWLAGADFTTSRILLKQLGLQIQARHIGLVSEDFSPVR